MHSHFFVIIVTIILHFGGGLCVNITDNGDVPFDQYYVNTWGSSHFTSTGLQVNMSLDEPVGGAGFRSKSYYGSGFFQMRIKLPSRNTAGVVVAFYLASGDGGSDHDELDFEFLGNLEGQPICLQTNVFTNDNGGREHRVNLWFDPSVEFHTYKILWNDVHIVFFVDNIPIRYFKKVQGGTYPSMAMQILTSIWNGSSWATGGGKIPINWKYSPFTASFEQFDVYGCGLGNGPTNNIGACNDQKYWWNANRYSDLDPTEKKAYQIVKHHYVTYDYCTDTKRYPVTPPECKY